MLHARLIARLGILSLLAFVLLLCVDASASPAFQGKGKGKSEKKGMEVFEEEDPYTKGEKELINKLGYARLGHGAWHKGEDTQTLQMNMGGVSMLFVETEHFNIASSLTTYYIPNNRDERDKIKGEFKRLKKKLGKFKPPKNAIDPWLRLHLYAQRAEDQYAAFCEEFGLSLADYGKGGLHLGYPNKIQLIICQRKSEFGRYVRNYHNSDMEYSYRVINPREVMIAAANIEALKEGWEMEEEMPFDSILHNMVTSTLTSSFVDGFNDNMYSAPRWFVYGLSHRHVRSVDPEWPLFDGRKDGQGGGDEHWDWEPRVYNLAKNEFFASFKDMCLWKKYEDLHQRDHMVSWSKVEFLLTKLEGDPKAFLKSICAATGGFSSNESDDKLAARQIAALSSHFGMTPEEFDKAWRKWVLKTYRKK